YGGPQLFNQDFSSVAADRNSETLVRSQRVPAQQTGVMAQWSYGGTRQTGVAGIEAREGGGGSEGAVFGTGEVCAGGGGGGGGEDRGRFRRGHDPRRAPLAAHSWRAVRWMAQLRRPFNDATAGDAGTAGCYKIP